MNIYYLPVTTLGTFHVWIYLILIATLWGKYYNQPHFTDEEIEAQIDFKNCPGSHNKKGQSQDLNPGVLAPESMLYNSCKILVNSVYFKGYFGALKRRKHQLWGAQVDSLR